MKNSILKTAIASALVLSAFADTATAATIYDKDGTTLSINGRIRARGSNGDIAPYPTTARKSGTLSNNARFGIEGSSEITNGIKAFAFTQWDTADGNHRESFGTRDQYVGVDFGNYGKVTLGRYLSPVYNVLAGTDIHYDFSGLLLADCTRRPGQIKYSFDYNGFSGEFAYQTAQDEAGVGFEKSIDVNSGFSTSLGYTFDDVVFGPLSLKFGYEYLKGQKEESASAGDYNNIKVYAAGLVWGHFRSGPYVALSYSESDHSVKSYQKDFKIKGLESVFGYGFENGIYADVGYDWQKYVPDKKTEANQSVETKGIIATVAWTLNPQFEVALETYFSLENDADKKHEAASGGDYYTTPYSKKEHAVGLNVVYFL